MTRRPVRTGLLSAICLSFLAFLVPAAALDFPPLSGRVVDEAGVLSPQSHARLDDYLRQHESRTTNQVVVVILKSLQGSTIEEFGYQLGRHWGIGQKGKNNGALLIVAPAQRQVRIEVGYGLEGELTDARTKLIIENVILPQFRAGNLEGGLVAGANAIVDVLEGRATSLPAGGEQADERRQGATPQRNGLFLVLLAVFAVLWIAEMGSRGGGRWPGGIGGGGFFGGGRRGGRGGFGRGFGGGGGGFGGGGASGRW